MQERLNYEEFLEVAKRYGANYIKLKGIECRGGLEFLFKLCVQVIESLKYSLSPVMPTAAYD